MSDWWEWAPGWLGLVGGAYGTWRARRTHRDVVRTQAKWEAIRDATRGTVVVRSLVPSTARGVIVETEALVLAPLPNGERTRRLECGDIRPRGTIELIVLEPHAAWSSILTVTWGHLIPGRRRREHVVLPPAPAPRAGSGR